MKQKHEISPFARNLREHIVPYIKPIMEVNDNLINYIKNLEMYLEGIEKRLQILEENKNVRK